MVLSHPRRTTEKDATKITKRELNQNAVMKGRCLLTPQPNTRGISKIVVYAMGISFRASRNVVGLVSTLARRVESISQSSSSTELLP
jgi:hypothetical protein